MATTGVIKYNPLKTIAVEIGNLPSDFILKERVDQGSTLFQAGDFVGAAGNFAQTLQQGGAVRGANLAIAVCFVRMGNFEDALLCLDEELKLSFPHPNAQQMKNDLLAWQEKVTANAGGITIFTIPKPFKGHNAIIQLNALHSWLKLRPRPEIILCGNDDGVAQVAADFGVQHIPEIVANQYGTPILSDVFKKAQCGAQNDVMAYVNADIILSQNFVDSVSLVNEAGLDKFLIVGQRWDFSQTETIDFSDSEWFKGLAERAKLNGTLHAATGKDYFIFPKGLWNKIPEFAIGRYHFDNWLVFSSLLEEFPVIDATKGISAFHQDHDYKHITGDNEKLLERPECLVNRSLAGCGAWHGHISDATWILADGQLTRKFNFENAHETINSINDLLNENRIPEAMILAAQLSEQKTHLSDILKRKIQARIDKLVFKNHP